VNRNTKLLFVVLLVLTTVGKAVSFGTAFSAVRNATGAVKEAPTTIPIPAPVSFREVAGRGLIVRVWINSAGPFGFAIDTGAGATLLSQRVADAARVSSKNGQLTSITGLSGVASSARDVSIRTLALGDSENYLPAKGSVMVTGGLPNDLDGVLDPTEAFAPLGYEIDLPRHQLAAFDPVNSPVRLNEQPQDGAVVRWLREGHGRRPFVQLDNGDRALLDTGSSLGLAIRERDAGSQRVAGYAVRDVSGGRISTRRAKPTTVAIGSLTLRNVPTDVIAGADIDAPVLLGLSALRPFRMRFDPVHRLIEIEPPPRRGRE
jgi:predicted aspartyl protease